MRGFRATRLYILLFGFIAACGQCGGSESEQSTLDRIKSTKTVRVGYANEAPYAYKDSESGGLTGEAPEIARVVLKKMGVDNVEGVLTEFGSLIPGLKAERFDIIAAGMYIKPKRCEQIAFSRPTYSIGEGFIVPKGNPKDLHSYEDILVSEDATLGVVAGAIERRYAREIGIPDERVIVFPDAPSAVEGVKAGRVDAYAGTALTVQDLVDKEQTGRVQRAAPFADPIIKGQTVRGYGAFGFRKADDEFREAFNKHLEAYIGSAEHAELVRPFGFTKSELPGDVTVERLCTPVVAEADTVVAPSAATVESAAEGAPEGAPEGE